MSQPPLLTAIQISIDDLYLDPTTLAWERLVQAIPIQTNSLMKSGKRQFGQK